MTPQRRQNMSTSRSSQSPGSDPKTPDLTDAIMTRLGYRRVSPQEARRLQRRRWMVRGGIVCVLLGAVLIASVLREGTPQIRATAVASIPHAISHDFESKQRQFTDLFDLFQDLTMTPNRAIDQEWDALVAPILFEDFLAVPERDDGDDADDAAHFSEQPFIPRRWI